MFSFRDIDKNIFSGVLGVEARLLCVQETMGGGGMKTAGKDGSFMQGAEKWHNIWREVGIQERLIPPPTLQKS